MHAGRLDGVFLAVVALIPLAAFELVAPLPVAAQALEGAQRSAARLSAVLDQPASVDRALRREGHAARVSPRPPRARSARAARARRARGRSTASTST